jgi:hypothetical protein
VRKVFPLCSFFYSSALSGEGGGWVIALSDHGLHSPPIVMHHVFGQALSELKLGSTLTTSFWILLLIRVACAHPSLSVRAQKSVGLVGGSPTYDLIEGFEAPDATARTYQYSPDGRLFALAVPSGCVKLATDR